VHDPDKTAVALSSMDPESRALVELSYRRGLGDDEIADLLQVDPDEVARRRGSALERLGVTGDELERLDDEHWAPRERPVAPPPRSPAPAPAPRRRAPAAALALLAVIAAVVLVVLLASGGDDGGGGDGDAARTPTRSETGATTDAADAKPPRQMRRLNRTYGHGTAQLVRSGGRTVLRLNVTDFLKPQGGGYAVWLYNAPDDARRLYATRATTIKRDIPLPRNFTRYRFAEVARAIPDLDSAHSGLSLLRARVAALAGP
jgi:hypothetical protein